MGAGVGQKRRIGTRTAPSANNDVIHDSDAWSRFVEAGDLQNQGVASYYLGEALSHERLRRGEQVLEIMNELFVDLLSVGAIILPKGRTCDDYALEFSPERGTLAFIDNANNCDNELRDARLIFGDNDPRFSSTDLHDAIEELICAIQGYNQDVLDNSIWF
jgi:hypothetical protein